MAAPAPLISVPRNLYKHFAALTVAITFCVAMFANGENKQAVIKQIQQHQAKQHAMTGGGHPAGLGELRDNRGSAASGSDDLPSTPVSARTLGDFVAPEPTDRDLVRALRRQRRPNPPPPKLPAVLPPGMPPIPGLMPNATEAPSPPPPG